MGTSAMMRATIPVGTVFSAMDTRPFPPNIRNVPMMPALRQWRATGRSPVRQSRNANSSDPATRKRVAAPTSGGIDALTLAMPRYVVPQTM
jgi:hypothetical protein